MEVGKPTPALGLTPLAPVPIPPKTQVVAIPWGQGGADGLGSLTLCSVLASYVSPPMSRAVLAETA